MSYTARYINPHRQFGKIHYEAILTDSEGILPPVRQWMKFSDSVTDDELIAAAGALIKRVATEQAALLAVKPQKDKTAEEILITSKLETEKTATLTVCDIDKPVVGTVKVTETVIVNK